MRYFSPALAKLAGPFIGHPETPVTDITYTQAIADGVLRGQSVWPAFPAIQAESLAMAKEVGIGRVVGASDRQFEKYYNSNKLTTAERKGGPNKVKKDNFNAALEALEDDYTAQINAAVSEAEVDTLVDAAKADILSEDP